MQVVTSKNKTKKRNKDWYWNVETPKKETKTKYRLFLLGYIDGGLKTKVIKRISCSNQTVFLSILTDPKRSGQKIEVF